MQLQTEKALLQEAFEIVSKAISAKSPLPILSHVLLEATDTALRLTATDLDLGIRLEVPCKTVHTGSTAVPAALFRDIVAKLPSGPVGLHATEARITVLAGRTKMEVCTLPAEEYPNLPAGQSPVDIELPQKTLKDTIRCVLPAVAKSDESRAVMTGVRVEFDGEHLVMCTTDGRRLAWVRSEGVSLAASSAASEPPAAVIIPGRAVVEIARACTDTPDPLTLRLEDNHAWVRVRNLEMHCRLLEGNFPDYKRVLPTSFLRFARIGREALVAGLRRMLIVAQERQSPNLVLLDMADSTLLLSANTPDLGLGTEEIPIVFEGAPLRIAFNGQYMLDSLKVLTCEEVHLDLQDDTRSAVLHEGDPNLRHVLMPVRLREAVPEEVATDA